MSKIMNVYYGQDTLPYKDKECQVHFPIIGQTFAGSSLVDTIKFYVGKIGGIADIEWLAIVKQPSGSEPMFQKLEADSDSEGVFVTLPLGIYYTQFKGDLYITLNGYRGGCEIVEEEVENSETPIYHVVGTPIVQVAGAVKLTIAYAPVLPQNTGALEVITVQQALALVSSKLDKNSPYFIKVVSNIDSNVINTPTYLPYLNSGDIVYSDYNKKFYKISGVAGSYVATEIELELGSLKVGTLDISSGINVDSFDDIYSETEENNLKGYIANELSGKVDKEVTSGDEIYAHHGSNQVLLPYAKGVYANNIPQRDDNGQINVPTTPTNNSHSTSKAYVDSAISSAISSVYKYKGSVDTYEDLPSTGNVVGDVYNVEDTGNNYAWTGTTWDALGGVGDLGNYYTKTETNNLLDSKADKSDTYTKTQVDNALSDKANKVGTLPNYTVNSLSDNALSFIRENNLTGKGLVITLGNTGQFIGQLSNPGADIISFELDRLSDKTRYTGVIQNGTSVTFNQLISSAYQKDFEETTNKVTLVSDTSTDAEYPSAKCLWDIEQNLRALAEGKIKAVTLSYQTTMAEIKDRLNEAIFPVYLIDSDSSGDIAQEILNDEWDNANIVNSYFNSTSSYIDYDSQGVTNAYFFFECEQKLYLIEWGHLNEFFNVGDIIYVVETLTSGGEILPDRWFDNTDPFRFWSLEGKIDFTDYTKKTDVPKYQATTIIVQDALTNINGRAFQNYTATLNTTNYTYYLIQKNGSNLTKEEASEYMKYMCGSEYVPEYNYDFPRNTLFIFADNSIWKPQFDNVNGLLLYKVNDGYATKTEVNAKSDLTNVAPTYDNTLTYTIGEVVSYNGKIYKCTTAITTPESWDSTHWEETSVASDFVNLTGMQVISGEKTFSNGINTTNLYLSGKINDNSSDFGLLLPDTSGFTDNQTIATKYDMDAAITTLLATNNTWSGKNIFDEVQIGTNNNPQSINFLGSSNRNIKFKMQNDYLRITTNSGNDYNLLSLKAGSSGLGVSFAVPIKSNLSHSYGLTIPDTTSFTADKEIATTDQITPQWYGTQAQYDALGTYDSNTIYNILES